MDAILVVNAGSSSVKFQVFGVAAGDQPDRLIKGELDGIGSKPRLRVQRSDQTPLIDKTYAPEAVPDVAAAMATAGAWLQETQRFKLIAVGHRVVHGGPDYDRPIQVDAAIVENLARYVSLAPLHQPNNLAPIRALLQRSPDLPQIACFDTAFHRGHAAVADHFAIPRRLHSAGVRRYGFHGLSYEYVAERLRDVAPEIAGGRVIVAHLGSGASMCALHDGRSVESTMGFTALDGLPMGTRPGQLDPGIVLYLLAQEKMSPEAVQQFLYQQCGLKGLSGVSNDVRELLASHDPGAVLALDYFVYRVGLHAGMLAAALSGLDAFVFTAGIGEKSPPMRARIADKLAWLGIELNPVANAAGRTKISADNSRVAVFVVPTDEELMIAKHALAVLSRRRSDVPVRERIA
jgi:acetate kinase